jgi:hypothetical protein
MLHKAVEEMVITLICNCWRTMKKHVCTRLLLHKSLDVTKAPAKQVWKLKMKEWPCCYVPLTWCKHCVWVQIEVPCVSSTKTGNFCLWSTGTVSVLRWHGIFLPVGLEMNLCFCTICVPRNLKERFAYVGSMSSPSFCWYPEIERWKDQGFVYAKV